MKIAMAVTAVATRRTMEAALPRERDGFTASAMVLFARVNLPEAAL
jgi:hypothetical protein